MEWKCLTSVHAYVVSLSLLAAKRLQRALNTLIRSKPSPPFSVDSVEKKLEIHLYII